MQALTFFTTTWSGEPEPDMAANILLVFSRPDLNQSYELKNNDEDYNKMRACQLRQSDLQLLSRKKSSAWAGVMRVSTASNTLNSLTN
jgi:hypothetical protein